MTDLFSGKPQEAKKTRLADIYAESRKKALQERAAALAPENNTVEAWRSHPIARGLRLPPNNPLVLEEKRRIVQGGL